ncbi:MAG: heavy-metal-associated domain-containing protein [Defluviitaleaceae bacterium]|nr:heavy-metal-associated domain-containing protein [Defluviitaleaceae bacterium]
MIKEFTLQGLGCANCAAKIERAASTIKGVSNVSVNFITATLRIEIADSDTRDIQSEIEKAVHRYEPDVRVIEKSAQGQAEIPRAANPIKTINIGKPGQGNMVQTVQINQNDQKNPPNQTGQTNQNGQTKTPNRQKPKKTPKTAQGW